MPSAGMIPTLTAGMVADEAFRNGQNTGTIWFGRADGTVFVTALAVTSEATDGTSGISGVSEM